ncbi:MAG: hypothetical protein ACE5FA_00385 [Dehalococcoidia bacterium]
MAVKIGLDIKWSDDTWIKQVFVMVYNATPRPIRGNLTRQLREKLTPVVNGRIEEIVQCMETELAGPEYEHVRDRLVGYARARRVDPGK